MSKFLYAFVLLFASFVFCGYATTDKIIEVKNYNGVYVFKIPQEHIKTIKPYVTRLLTFNKNVYDDTNAELVVNGGYFDPNNKSTSSYVVVDGKVVLDPKTNQSLISNQAVKPHLEQIFNRSEFRVLDCKGKQKFDIRKHSEPPFGLKRTSCKIVHSIQAGPELYPALRLEDEYFVEYKDGVLVRDSISAMKKCARTAIGIKDNDVYIIIATIFHKMTLPELAQFCKTLKLTKAMNFDGGGSTSIDFRGNSKYEPLSIISDKNKSARKLKSFLVIN